MKRDMWLLTTLMVLVVALGSGCAPKMASSPVVETVVVEKMVEREMAKDAAEYAGSPASNEAKSLDLDAGAERMIIQTVNMVVVVESTDATLAALNEIVAAENGYISQSSRYLRNEQAYANLTLRVPASTLSEVLETIRGMAIRVENESLSGDDVTEEYMDIQARLRNLEATEAELLELLTEVRENRGKAEDILAVHRELTNIRGQIESLKGRSQYLSRMTALATIHLEVRPKEAPRPVVEKAKWNPLLTLNRALRGFVSVLQFMVDLLIYVIVYSPYILVPVAVIWLLARMVRRRKGKKDVKSEA